MRNIMITCMIQNFITSSRCYRSTPEMSLAFRFFHRSIHVGRIVPEIDPTIGRDISDKAINPKRLPTRRNIGLTRLPAQLEFAAQKRIKQVADSNFRLEAKELINILHKLKLPDNSDTIKLKKADIKTKLEIRDKIRLRPEYEPDVFKLHEESKIASIELKQIIQGSLDDKVRDWHYYEYDDYASDLYMATRLAPNYASVRTVMSEIHDLIPSFEPRSVLDFGSGMGTTIWAVNETWPKSVQEFMNVDLSKHQQSLCEYLLRGGQEFGDTLNGVFHRQYLPTSNKVKYDLVVAAFSMLEIPNAELRTHTIENLWHKTNELLVIIERGNRGGFSIIDEARNFVLDMCGHDVTKKIHLSIMQQPKITQTVPGCHVFAPCPHEFACPKANMPSKNHLDTCRFKVVFEPLELGAQKSGLLSEHFSYVVLRKSPHPSYATETNIRWPRIVDKRKHSRNQITQMLCCPNGALAETVITKKKYGKEAYEIAKSCDWGDIIPIKVNDNYFKKSEKELIADGKDDDKRE